MGMHTELNIGVQFKKNLPDKIVEVLKYMTENNNHRDWKPNLKHPLFETERWSFMLWSDSFYFDALPYRSFEFCDISEAWYLTCIFNVKNYSSEIEHFLDFIASFIEAREKLFIGYKRYEEDTNPTLLYVENGKILTKEVI